MSGPALPSSAAGRDSSRRRVTALMNLPPGESVRERGLRLLPLPSSPP